MLDALSQHHFMKNLATLHANERVVDLLLSKRLQRRNVLPPFIASVECWTWDRTVARYGG
jgi:hypothetical protein